MKLVNSTMKLLIAAAVAASSTHAFATDGAASTQPATAPTASSAKPAETGGASKRTFAEIFADLETELKDDMAREAAQPTPRPSAQPTPKPAPQAPAVAVKPVVRDEDKPAVPAPKSAVKKPSEELPRKETLTLDLRTLLEKPIAPKRQEPAPAPAPAPRSQEKLERPKQYIVLSFDGSRSIQMWKETRALANELDIGLTVFMSGVHFLPATLLKKYYDPPGDKYGPGMSAIKKISDDDAGTIPLRMEQVEQAVGEGIEVGSHAVGHFDAGHGPGGLNWSTTDWVLELTQFQNILLNIFHLNGLPERYPGESQTWKELVGDSLRGFRAPFLSTNGTLAPALEKLGYRYDGSEAYPMEWGKWPFKKKDANVWEIPMAQIPIVGTAKTQVAMDYNFYAFDSKAMPDPANSAFYQERWFQSLMNYFRHNYYGNRAPIHIGAHFDDYNGRAYFTGFFRFARAVCRKPEVVCLTGSDLIKKMQALGPDRIAQLQKGNFEKLPAPPNLPDIKTLDLKIAWTNSNGVLHLEAQGKNAPEVQRHDLHVHVVINNEVIATALGDVKIPMSTGIQQIKVRVFKDGTEVLSSTRRADIRAGQVRDIEQRDREELLKKGDLPGAHGLPDTSGIL